MVMFHGMVRHRGIRTDSQDAARTAGGHSAQDTASRETESPGDSMVLGRFTEGMLKSVSLIHGGLDPETDVCSLPYYSCSAAATARGSRRRELLSYSDFHLLHFLYPSFSPAPLLFPPLTSPLLFLPHSSPLSLSSVIKSRFLLDEKSTSVKLFKAGRCVSLHLILPVVWSHVFY